ncbi:MAG: RNA-guided endonuclease InsQ/TnpB family protein, partial [Candidatus Heimdallarchaeota archaeon]
MYRKVAHKCKNRYNRALYIIKQHYLQTSKFLKYNDLYHLIKGEQCYLELSSDSAQQLLRRLNSNYIAFFNAKKKSIKSAKPPKYLPKDGFTTFEFIPRQIRVELKETRLSLGKRGESSMGRRYLYIPHFNLPGKLKIIRIIPRLDAEYFEVDYVYEFEEPEAMQTRKNLLAIDPGLDNFASIVSSNETALILEGRGLKSYNRYYNKKLAKIQAEIDMHRSKAKLKCKKRLIRNRNAVIDNFMYLAVNLVLKICLDENIDCVIVGDWGDMKRGLPMWSKTGQLFQQIPYGKFKKRLETKCKILGIEYINQEESYTSKTCSGCGLVRGANRVHRGLYRCRSCGLQLNADINAAINIMRKVAPNSLSKWSSGDIISP